jgi:hypothetical protein
MSTTFWIQLLGVIFGSAMIYFSFVKYKRKEINSSEVMVWMIGWIVLMAVAISPGIIDFVIEPLNFYRRLDFFVVFGFFVLLVLGFYNYGVMKKLERKLEVFVRKDAVLSAEKRKKDE